MFLLLILILQTLSGNTALKYKELFPVLEACVLLLDENTEKKISNHIKRKINVQNATTYFNLAKNFKLFSLSQLSLDYIERCFTMVVDSHNFLELDDTLVAKILSSSKLNTDTELEVLYSAVIWLNHNVKERTKFVTKVLLKVRLPLISDHTLKYLFSKTSSFSSTDDRVAMLNEILQLKKNMYTNKSNNYYTNRYYSQKKFCTFVCGGLLYNNNLSKKKLNRKTYKIEMNSLKCREVIAPMKVKRMSSHAFCIKGEVYVCGGKDNHYQIIRSIEKYSPATNTWKRVAETLNARFFFCSCSFATKIFIIGGCARRRDLEDNCVTFDTRNKKWRQIAPLNEGGKYAACSVFGGKVVVSGGWNNASRWDDPLKSVEVYDHVADEWSYMPDMNEGRSSHKSVAIQNKLFVIGGTHGTAFLNSIEVFDCTCKKFAFLKPFPDVRRFVVPKQAFAFGSEIIVYGKATVLAYDVQNNEWLEKSCRVIEKKLCGLSYAKVPDLLANI